MKICLKYRHKEYIYEGECSNNLPHGHGKLYAQEENGSLNLVYKGSWFKGVCHGHGKADCGHYLLCMDIDNVPNKIILPDIEDKFNLHKPSGSGLVLPYSNTYYEGSFYNGRIQGEGKVYVAYNGDCDGNHILKKFLDNDINYENYLVYHGELSNGKLSGYGKFIDHENKNHFYKGYFKKSKFHGHGSIYLNGQLLIEGEFNEGFLESKAKIFHKNGNLMFEGEFKKDRFNGPGKEFDNNGNIICEGLYNSGLIENGHFNSSLKNLLYKRFSFFKKRKIIY